MLPIGDVVKPYYVCCVHSLMETACGKREAVVGDTQGGKRLAEKEDL